MTGLRIYLFGTLRLFDHGRPLTELGYPRAKIHALLGYLLLHRRQPVRRARLAFLLWPDALEEEAFGNLRRALHTLGRALPARDFLRVDRQFVGWNPGSDYWLDIEAFESLAATGALTALAEAVDLYTGDLLEDSSEDWLEPERERLRALYFEASERLIAARREQGAHASAVVAARRLLAADPLREQAHRALMASLYLAGDRSAALRQYEECRALLRRELDVEPLPETEALRERILAGEALREPARAAPPTPSEPADARGAGATDRPGLAGREAEMDWLRGRWRAAAAGQGAVVLLAGEAGIGKSRLMVELRGRLEDAAEVLAGGGHLPERLLPYHPIIEALRSRGPALASDLAAAGVAPETTWWLPELARLLPELRERWPWLAVSPTTGGEPDQLRLFQAITACLRAQAARRPLLLLLDDLQWADEATLAWLAYAARVVGQVPVLLVGAYRVEEVAPPLEELRRELSHAGLLHQRALDRLGLEAVGQIVRDLAGGIGDATDLVRRLHEETDGNPLFVVETLRALAEAGMLGAGRAAPAEISRAGRLPLPPTVREVIVSRLDRLSARARQVVEAAAVAGRRFDDRLAARAGGRSEEEAVAGIEEALRAQIIAEAEGGYRFTHDRIQEVAYDALSRPRRRLLHRRVAEALEASGGSRPEVAGILAHHYSRAEEWARAADFGARAAERAKRLYASAEALGYFDLALAALARLEEAAGAAAARAEIRRQRFGALSERQGVWMLVGKYPEARADLEEMVGLARDLGDDALLSDALNGLGNLLLSTGRPDEARTLLEEALTAKRRTGDRAGMADSLNLLGTIYVGIGEVKAGLHALEEGRAVRTSLGNDQALGRSEWMLGLVRYEFSGEYESAIRHLEAALALARRIGDRALASGSLQLLGAAQIRLGDYDTGFAYLDEALAEATTLGDRAAEGWCLLYRAWGDRETGDRGVARARSEAALAVGQELGEHTLTWYALYSLARLDLAEGRVEDALAQARAAEELAEKKSLWHNLRVRAPLLRARIEVEMSGGASDGQALGTIRRLLDRLGAGLPELRVSYFDAYRALRAAGQPEARDFLARAYAQMMAQAADIADPVRRERFLVNIAINRAIRSAWETDT